MGLIPHHGGAYFYGSAAQLVDADNNGGLAIDGNQFTLKPGQGALDDPHFLAGLEPGGVERYRLVGEIEHEPEPVHLFFGNLGGGMFAPQHQVAEHGGVGEDGTLFNAIHVHEDHHGDQYPLHPLLAVAPLTDLVLYREEVLDPQLRQPVTHPLLVVHLHIGCQPSFLSHRYPLLSCRTFFGNSAGNHRW